LINAGAWVKKAGSKSPEQGNFMHCKFYIVDDTLAKAGSFNWTLNASSNRETLDEVPAEKKIREFESILEESVNFFDDIKNPEKKVAKITPLEKKLK
jgi:phosphatidylserine/phosphatidylglycerophosphate/cardiolipin synthase-like enzyme